MTYTAAHDLRAEGAATRALMQDAVCHCGATADFSVAGEPRCLPHTDLSVEGRHFDLRPRIDIKTMLADRGIALPTP